MIHVARNGAQLGRFIVEEINMKLASGEFLPSDLAWTDGMAAWEPLERIPGVILPLRPAGPPAPPALPVTDPFAPPQSMAGQYPYAVSPPTSGLAIGSMICGILAILCFAAGIGAIILGTVAVALGHTARSGIRKSNGSLQGDGMALAGLITGYIGLSIGLLFWGGIGAALAFGH